MPGREKKDVDTILNSLLLCVDSLLKEQLHYREEQEKINLEFERRVRANEDYTDEVHQRSLKGNIILTSRNRANIPSLIKPPEQLAKEKISITKHATELLSKKYGVDLPESDIQAIHYLTPEVKGGKKQYNNILIKVWNRKEGSAWSSLVENIKKGGAKDVNAFGNFQLTSRRNTILYNLRKLRAEKKIAKIFTNENGQIFYKEKEDSAKIKLTFATSKEEEIPRTISGNELFSRFS